MSAKAMTGLLVALGVLIAVACTIPFLALTDEYDRAMASDAQKGRVVEIVGDKVRYARHDPDNARAKDGGWIEGYATTDIPEAERSKLKAGDELVLRKGRPELAWSPPSPLLLVGAGLGLFFAIWAFIAPGRERRKLKALADDSDALIAYMVKKTRSTQLFGAAVFYISGAFMGVVVLFSTDSSSGERIGLGVFAGFCVLLGVFITFKALKMHPERAPVILALRDHPERIVWVYVTRVVTKGISSYNVNLCLDEKKKTHVFNLRQLEPEILLTVLRPKLPHAVFGYNIETEALYNKSPADFLTHFG